jgi:hypothetical protein
MLLVALAVALTVGCAVAAPSQPQPKPLTYNGTFSGIVYGDRESQAPLTLELVQQGEAVTGIVTLEEGLFIDGGRCGQVNVPPTQQEASGWIVPEEPGHLQTSLAFDVGGFTIQADLDGQLSADGELLTAEAFIDLPWLCGRDPQLTAEMTRALAEEF